MTGIERTTEELRHRDDQLFTTQLRKPRRAFLGCAALVLAAILLSALPALAADKIRAGKTIGVLFDLTPVDVGVAEGIFAKYGLDVEITTMTGDQKLMQAFISDSVDVGLSSSSGFAFAVKGVPIHGVAALAGAPRNFSLIVNLDSPIQSAKDLKGKKFGIAGVGTIVDWLVKRVSLAEGWGPDGIVAVETGGFEATVALLKTRQIDGFIGATELGYQLEERHAAKMLGGMEKFVPRFHTNVIDARDAYIHDHPDRVERFLKGMFASVAFMKANREKTIAIAARVLNMSPEVVGKTYDYEISMLSDDGTFDPESIKVLKDSFVEMNLLPAVPADDQLFTTQFVPVKP